MFDRPTAERDQEELLRRIAGGDQQALAEMYDQLAGVLFSMAIHILADRREAEEVVQDVFVQIWKKAASFDSALGTPLHWTLGIIRNRCVDYLRARQRRSRLLDDAIEDAGADGVRPVAPELSALTPEELAAVRSAVAALPADQHQAIAMAFFGGMTHLEISAALNEPLGTIKARIRRGMLKLQESLKAYV
jgi:RNA polymerase sigma-70 factor (ECF subfamily)